MLLNILTNVTWLNYLIVIAVVLVLYYLFIGIRYYSDELKEVFTLSSSTKQNSSLRASDTGNHTNVNEAPILEEFEQSEGFEDTVDETFEMVERLIATLKSMIQDSAEQQLDNVTFSERLRKILEYYGDLKHSQFQFAINELIISECEKIDFNPPSEDELLGLW